MALGSLPPWLNVSPRDFVLAAAQGAQLGHQIADSTMRAWEEQARMRMASQEAAARREQAAYQHEVETAANRLAADRLEQYRQQEIQNAKAGLGLRGLELGSTEERNKTLQQRADDTDRHNQAMEKLREEAILASAKSTANRPDAGIVTLPGAPGYTFLKNTTGSVTPLTRPMRQQSDLERARLQLSALNAMAPKGGEDALSMDYHNRTNAIGGILRSLTAPPLDVSVAPPNAKDRTVNTPYRTPKGVFTWTGSGWAPLSQPASGTIPNSPTEDASLDEDAE